MISLINRLAPRFNPFKPFIIPREYSSIVPMTEKRKPQNEFYFEKSPLLSKYKSDSQLYAKLFEKIPIVLLMGWAGARDQNLKKYIDIYSNMGYHVLRFAPSFKLTFVDTQEHPKYAYRLLDMMKDEHKLVHNPIITHFFSNASCGIVYQHILSEINKDGGSKEYDFFKKNHKALIFDSAPGWPVPPIRLVQGISDLNRYQLKNCLIRYSVSSLIVMYALSYHFFQFGNHYFTRMYNALRDDPRSIPTLSMYSKADKLLSSVNMQHQIEQRKLKQPNLYLKSVVYEDAEHVMIFLKYPERYLELVNEHLKLCKVDMNTILSELGVAHECQDLVKLSRLKSKI
jgi:hypothetical protein